MSNHSPSSQASTSTITLPPRPRPRPVKKPLVKLISPPPLVIPTGPINPSLDTSPLTPLSSSPIESRKPQNFPKLSPEPTLVFSSQAKESAAIHTPRKPAPKSGIREEWDINKLGTRVWVLIDRFGRVSDSEDLEELESQSEARIWWPGKITSTLHTRPLRVTLTNPPGTSGNTIAIADPCKSNILPWTVSTGRIRFGEPVFINIALLGGTHASPRKKQKVDSREDLKRRWQVAVEEITSDISIPPKKSPVFTSKKMATEARHRARSVKTDEEGDSDLPEVGTEEFRNYTPTSSPAKIVNLVPSQGRSKRKRSSDDESSDDDSVFLRATWSPRPPDFMVSIPGELVLAVERANDSIYWPARVLDYQAADRQNKPDKYHVEFLDGKRQYIPRRWFYIAEEEGFAKCKLGKWDSTIKEVLNDDETNPTLNNEPTRSPSPVPADPPPLENFKDLSIREQFVYTKPVLSATLNENFPPALQRHANFLAGGSKRQGVVEEAGLRGQMDPRDVDALQRYVTDWCLRDEQRAEIIVDDEDTSIPSNAAFDNVDRDPSSISSFPRAVSPAETESLEVLSDAELPPTSSFAVSEGTPSTIQQDIPTSSLPRQYGCAAFEALSRSEKVDYCLNVLLPETILQILLWRNGERISTDLLPDSEEALLYEKGVELLNASDWVNDVMRLRMAAVGQLGKSRKGQKKDAGEVLYSNTGRPRRGVGAPKSYLE
ncbi:hypothetical protein H0H92_002989 [Tricholoma furcatifolium]|nr:hypothetical protein H0H92_002989 [Tricholoma furcatifolium]